MSDVKVTALQNGPFQIEGNFTLSDGQGNVYPSATPMYLCRCGHAGKKPFCDGSHAKHGFQAAETAPKA